MLFACFKRNLRKEIKVAQLAGYVSEHSAYHHGEVSITLSSIDVHSTHLNNLIRQKPLSPPPRR